MVGLTCRCIHFLVFILVCRLHLLLHIDLAAISLDELLTFCKSVIIHLNDLGLLILRLFLRAEGLLLDVGGSLVLEALLRLIPLPLLKVQRGLLVSHNKCLASYLDFFPLELLLSM